MRMTARQQAVRAALSATGTFVSAQDVHAQLRAAGHRIGLTTVYRALQALEGNGDVDVLRAPDGRRAYRACGGDHHHHLICRACGRTEEVPASALEQWASAVVSKHGFTEVGLAAEFFGTCPDCAPTG
jgi:Fur family ferric uptake transcriptional regulator